MNKNNDAFDVCIDDAFDFLSQEYAELFKDSDATAFQHPLWLSALYSKLAPAMAAKPLIVVVRDRAAGALAAVLPLLRLRRGPMRTIEFADLRVSDYLAPVCTVKKFADLLQDQSACAKLRQLIRPFDLLRLPQTARCQNADRESSGGAAPSCREHEFVCNGSTTPFEQWQANALNPSYRKELAKKWRQLQKKGALTFSCCTDSASIMEAMEAMKKFRGPRFQAQGDGDLLQRPEYFDFYSDVELRGLGSFVRLYVMKIDGNVIATVLGLSHRDSFLILMTAFDIAGYKSQSIGSLTFERVAKACIDRGDHVLDFTIGDEPYKKLFGGRPSPISSVTQAGSAAGAVAMFALKQAPWIKQAVKRMADFRAQPIRTSTDTQ
ncbi:GNAT family N-acetyltransferase [Bradyrhizobium sp. ISRA435]|nr:GNAT family N-acetyltransferase [Bradyrhizobium sp. ISRA435]